MVEHAVGRFVAAAILVGGAGVPAMAATRLVPAQYATIQAAIDDAVNGDEIIVADGTYTGAGNRELDPGGRAITIRSENGPAACIIDCETSGRAFNIENGEGPDTRIEGLQVTRGGFDPFLDRTVILRNASPTFVDCVFVDNPQVINAIDASPTFIDCWFQRSSIDAGGSGGAIFLNGGELTLVRCDFVDNYSDDSGGAVYAKGSVFATDCRFVDNDAYYYGGAIEVSEGTLVASRCDFISNDAQCDGGAIGASCPSVTLTGCRFEANDGASKGGGAALFADKSVTIVDCVFERNRVGADPYGDFDTAAGGGLSIGGSAAVTLRGCSFVENHAINEVARGGGLSLSAGLGPVAVVDCTFEANRTSTTAAVAEGSGVVAATPTTFVNCVFTRNRAGSASPMPGASAIQMNAGGMTLINCLIAEEAVEADTVLTLAGGGTIVNSTIVHAGTTAICTEGRLDISNSIARAGGATLFHPASTGVVSSAYSNVTGGRGPGVIDADPVFVDADNDDYRLVAGTAGVDAGDNTAVPADAHDLDGDGDSSEPLPIDMNGAVRFADDGCATDVGVPGGAMPTVDMGAAELLPLIPEGCDCNFNGTLDELDISAEISLDCNDDGVPDECGVVPDCNGNGVPDSCDLADASSADCDSNGVPDECDADCNGNGVPDACDLAEGTSVDRDGDGFLDECTGDCNGNGVPDGLDVMSGTSRDCAADGIPDECQPLVDCNNDGSNDACDIADGESIDCDANGVPDECETDCNGNGVGDACDIMDGRSEDCDGNGVPDQCDVFSDCNGNGMNDVEELCAGTAVDCDANGILDECQTFADCNGNGIADYCDVAVGTSEDCNGDGVPNECDADCNGNGISDVCDGSQFLVTSPSLGPVGPNPLTFSFSAEEASGDVTFAFVVTADIDLAFEFIVVRLNGTLLGRVYDDNGEDCVPSADQLTLDAATFNALTGGGPSSIVANPTAAVSAVACEATSLTVSVVHALPSSLAGCPGDLDRGGNIGFGDLLALLTTWGPCGPCCPADVDGDDDVGFGDLTNMLMAWGDCI